MISYGHLTNFLKSDFLFHIHFSVVLCDFLVKSSQINIVLMHVSFKIHYRNNLIDKKDSYLISYPSSQDDRNYSYGHQLYPSDNVLYALHQYEASLNLDFIVIELAHPRLLTRSTSSPQLLLQPGWTKLLPLENIYFFAQLVIKSCQTLHLGLYFGPSSS